MIAVKAFPSNDPHAILIRSLAFLLVTSVIWHAAAPSIKVAPESDVVFLKGPAG